MAALLAGFRVCQTRCHVRLQSLLSAGNPELDGAFGAVNIVSENMQSRSIALSLDGHSFLQL